MNLICNNCGGADIYNIKGLEFSNPFIWSLLFADDMISLIQEYDNINFMNFESIRLSFEVAKENSYDEFNNTITGILIDNKIKLFFTHYLYGPQKIPTKIGPNTFYYKNFEYAYNKYVLRIKRMLENKEEPKFLIIAYKRHGWTKEKIEKLLQENIKYKVMIITDENIKNSLNNIKIIKLDRLNDKFFFPLDAIKACQFEIFDNLGI